MSGWSKHSEWSYTYQDLNLNRTVCQPLGTGEEGRAIAARIVRALNGVDEDLDPQDQYQARLVGRTWNNYSGLMTEWEEVDE